MSTEQLGVVQLGSAVQVCLWTVYSRDRIHDYAAQLAAISSAALLAYAL
jgi:hypothetical protein